MECQYCSKKFKNNSSLNKHKNSAKYCIRIQEKLI